jgi:hypothetical protein
MSPHAPYTVADDHLVEAWKLAEELGVRTAFPSVCVCVCVCVCLCVCACVRRC